MNYERVETESAGEVEEQSYFKVTLEYRLSWEVCMYSTHSSKSKRNGRRANVKPSGRESAILCGPQKDKRAAAVLTDDGDESGDLLTKNQNSSRDSSPCSLDGGGSGPSSPQVVPGVGRSGALCPCCRKVWEKAGRTKKPLKDKLLDTDPTSLSCDQWVLKKRRRRDGDGGLRFLDSTLEGCLKLIQRRRSDVTRGPSVCSRPHAFLQRNLRLCTKPSARRGRRRRKRARRTTATATKTTKKRARSDPHRETLSPAKQRRNLPTAADRSHGDPQSPSPLSGSGAAEDDGSDEGDAGAQGPARITLEVVPSTVTMETAVKQKAGAGREGPAVRGSFKDLLTQLRGNSRMIVREDRQ